MDNLTVAFHQCHLSERGTTVALYDYADYNETILGNKSIIIYQRHHVHTNTSMESKIKDRFETLTYSSFKQVEDMITEHNIDYFYCIKYGHPDEYRVTSCPNLVHSVFTFYPHGEKYALVSDFMSEKYHHMVPAVPHIVRPYILPEKDMREELGIPEDALVFGRYGGYETFDIMYVHSVIKYILGLCPNHYFIFMNTKPFCVHDRVKFLETKVDMNTKNRFIATCDAIIHARWDGETFGLSVGEFSAANKPIITCNIGYKSHIQILGDRAILYNNLTELLDILTNFRDRVQAKGPDYDWNAYRDYEPEKIMERFREVFLA